MIDPKTLILRRLHDEEKTEVYGRRKRIERKLRQYRVETREGKVLGRVFESMACFETRTRGKRYVNSRWHSPRWYYSLSADYSSRESRIFDETRAGALDALLSTLARDGGPDEH